ncbi:MAG: T9SS type A sorting domain-containing protein [Owenweeksia sp.]
MFRISLAVLVLISVCGQAQVYKQSAKVIASDRSGGNQFGFSVDLDGDWAIVGAHTKCDSINGQKECYVGAAYLFKRDSLGWHQVQKLTASDKEKAMEFGNSVSINGNVAVVGAYKEDVGASNATDYGAVYVYELDSVSELWNETQKIVPSLRVHSGQFGFVVDVLDGKLAVSSNQRSLNNGSGSNITYAGSVYIFRQDSMGVWQEFQEVLPDSSYGFQRFGHSISLSDSVLAVGVPDEDDTVYGQFVNRVGAAYVYALDTAGYFQQVQRLNPGVYNPTNGGNNFGHSIACNKDIIVVGEPGRRKGGAASVFIRDSSGTYVFGEQLRIVQNWNAYKGQAVAIKGKDVFIAAPGHQHPASLQNPGCVYWYQKDSLSNQFHLQQVVYSDDGEDDDNFGNSISVNGDQLFVGAFTEEHDLNGGGKLPLAGSAYHFDLGCHGDTVPVYQNNYMLSSDQNFQVSYQWLYCDSGFVPIKGATQYNYQVVHNGSYAVVRNWNGCSDTSDCVLISGIGLKNADNLNVNLFPNPFKNSFTIDLGRTCQNLYVEVVSIIGEYAFSEYYRTANSIEVNFSTAAPGVYLVRVQGQGLDFTQKVIKE